MAHVKRIKLRRRWVWIVDYVDHQGRRHRSQFETRERADAHLAERIGELRQAAPCCTDPDVTSQDYVETVWKLRVAGEVAHRTLEDYLDNLDRHVLPQDGADKPRGGGAYVREKGFGGEIFNFRRDDDGAYRGYVRPPGSKMDSDSFTRQRININNLGAKTDDDRVDGVSVYWVATHPALDGTRVVGLVRLGRSL